MNDRQIRPDLSSDYVRALTGAQMSLFAFICVLLGNRDEARDVLQDTNAMLVRHAAEYDPSQAFLPWAKAFGYNQVRAYLRRVSRSRLVFDEDLVNTLAEETAVQAEEDAGGVLHLLDICMARLTSDQRELIQARYYRRESAENLAKRLKRSVVSVRVQTHRIRHLLRTCIEEGRACPSAAGGET